MDRKVLNVPVAVLPDDKDGESQLNFFTTNTVYPANMNSKEVLGEFGDRLLESRVLFPATHDKNM